VITIASLRYRLPLEPFLILMAAAVVGPLAERLVITRLGKATAAC
jgi:hypothetical protein